MNDSYRVAVIRAQDDRQYAMTVHVTDLKVYHIVDGLEEEAKDEENLINEYIPDNTTE